VLDPEEVLDRDLDVVEGDVAASKAMKGGQLESREE